jgi:hypothetical protein
MIRGFGHRVWQQRIMNSHIACFDGIDLRTQLAPDQLPHKAVCRRLFIVRNTLASFAR